MILNVKNILLQLQLKALELVLSKQREQSYHCYALTVRFMTSTRIRPSGILDFFAEMVKSDEHMGKVKANLLTQKSNIEKREKARQMRHQKKFAKDVQRYVQRDFRSGTISRS